MSGGATAPLPGARHSRVGGNLAPFAARKRQIPPLPTETFA